MIDSYGAHGDREMWLGIDPGVTTGWAMIDGARTEVLGSGNLDEPDLKKGLDTLIRFAHNEGRVIRVVIERVPRSGIGRLSRRLTDINSAIREVVEEVYSLSVLEVMPGEWKQSRVAKMTLFKRGAYTAHQRDAIRMTLYTIDREARRNAD